jgi:anthranilate synthase/aminodeoxychorismate synthase-like glutamine amidotransferase
VVISPGPKTPDDAGICVDLVRHLGHGLPILGVCLGHQAIGEAYGGVVTRAPHLMHGKRSLVRHDGAGIFAGVPNPFEATRYHSLMVSGEGLPGCLEVTARTEDGDAVIMALRHRQDPVVGVQFHPESIGTEPGRRILANFLAMTPAPLGARP